MQSDFRYRSFNFFPNLFESWSESNIFHITSIHFCMSTQHTRHWYPYWLNEKSYRVEKWRWNETQLLNAQLYVNSYCSLWFTINRRTYCRTIICWCSFSRTCFANLMLEMALCIRQPKSGKVLFSSSWNSISCNTFAYFFFLVFSFI